MKTGPYLASAPVSSVCNSEIHTWNGYKKRSPVLCALWTPEGRRLLTGNKKGEYAVLSGLAFNLLHQFANIETAVNGLTWVETQWMKNETDLLLSACGDGKVYYFQSNMVCIKEVAAHDQPVRALSMSPPASKFVTCSDDGTLKVWDIQKPAAAEMTFTGHGHNVTTCHWHPTMSLVASGSNDRHVRLWDVRSKTALTDINNVHRNTVLRVQWNMNGNWLLSGGKDSLIKLIDIRTLKELYTFEGHKKDVTSIDWHPHHAQLFVSCGADTTIKFWIVGHQSTTQHGHNVCEPVADKLEAHGIPSTRFTSTNVQDVKWHPLGHLVASAGQDSACKIWGRKKTSLFTKGTTETTV
eukprot:TRINITY_DN65677_c4_g1_i1.p1 TRINITY_DN65677_c4_g1~~TRINITY_DN65677_c4_g1_i1.p1  ORF type:complete len:400 (-),score=11.92 TRINITY_DN65677_c4_g1_i1:24-1082(-)